MSPYTVAALVLLAWFILGGGDERGQRQQRNPGDGVRPPDHTQQQSIADPSATTTSYTDPANLSNETAQPIGSDVGEEQPPPSAAGLGVEGHHLIPPPRSVGRAQLRVLTTTKQAAGGGPKGFS